MSGPEGSARVAARALLINAAELLRRPGSERTIELEVGTEALGLTDARFRPGDQVGVHLRLEGLTDGIVVLGTIDVPWHGACRRCLQPLDAHTASEVDEVYQTVVTNPDAFEMVGDQLDLLPMVRELALLDAPEAPLCRPDCAGLCPVCGIDLNESTCECEPPVLGSVWDVLDQLKVQVSDPLDQVTGPPDTN
ncbi:MAG: hypothetical protein JWM34_3666 [Ilumatobacteraceae bacterium]|nr:hypothetical protein [Ilumatobacteraceae bacterium]